jgi:hypothetical protein
MLSTNPVPEQSFDDFKNQFMAERSTVQAQRQSQLDKINSIMANSGQQYTFDPTDPNKMILVPTTNPLQVTGDGTTGTTTAPAVTDPTAKKTTGLFTQGGQEPQTDITSGVSLSDLEKQAARGEILMHGGPIPFAAEELIKQRPLLKKEAQAVGGGIKKGYQAVKGFLSSIFGG